MSDEKNSEERLETFKHKVEEYKKATFTTQNGLARKTGYSPAVLSQIMSGSYKGDTEKVIKAVSKKIDDELANLSKRIKDVPFVETSVYERMCDVLSIADMDKKIVVIIGETGIGKSIALNEYCSQNPSAIFIGVDDTYRYDTIIRDIAEKINIDSTGYTDKVMKRVVGKLTSSDRMVIVDEAERLPLKALSILRRLHDKTGVPVAIVGLPKLYDNIISRREDMKQVYSRMRLARIDFFLNLF